MNETLFELAGYCVFTAGTLDDGRRICEKHNPDLIILDIFLPDGNGLKFCSELRKNSDVRIFFLSALGTKKDVLNGLKAGGDDYLPKPYLPEELLLRVEALLRRGSIFRSGRCEENGPLTWHRISKQVFAGADDLRLKPREYDVLELLTSYHGEYLAAEEIYRVCWNSQSLNNVSPVHNQIYHLRIKLNPYGIRIKYLRNRGYRIQYEIK